MNAARIADQIAQVDRDLAEVDEQVEVGELDEATADRLRSAYRAERGALEKQLDDIEPVLVVSDEADGPTGRSKSRSWAGAAIVGVGVVVIAVVAVFSLQERTPAGEATDGVATEVLEGAGGADLASVSLQEMEAVVAQNPDIPGMRIALADRYVAEGNYSKGLEHYMVVLDLDPDDPEALARVGWLTFLSGEPSLAAPFVERALVIQPDFPQAYWFLANIRMEVGDAVGAIDPLQRLLAYELPIDVRAEAEALLAEARS
ncbi:MAG: tetratricopeptide repeat protein [Actinomycetota bacterium]|nr:tetratricopeptide repeat protein [Actinomycetota bacterium]